MFQDAVQEFLPAGSALPTVDSVQTLCLGLGATLVDASGSGERAQLQNSTLIDIP